MATGALTALVLLFLASPASGQTGRIEIRVVDESGDPIPGARITAYRLGPMSWQPPRESTTDERGLALLDLPPGEFEFVIELEGFKTTMRAASVEYSQTTQLEFEIPMGAFGPGDTVTVIEGPGEPEPIERDPLWNAWLTRKGRKPTKVASEISRNRKYELHLDLSLFDYGTASNFKEVVTGVPLDSGFRERLRDLLDSGETEFEASMRPVVLGDSLRLSQGGVKAHYWADDDWQPSHGWLIPMQIDLARLFEAEVSGSRWTEEFLDRTRAAGVRLRLDTTGTKGCSLVGLTIWDETGQVPLDHFVHAVSVGEEGACGDEVSSGELSSAILPGNRVGAASATALYLFEAQVPGDGTTRSAAIYAAPGAAGEGVASGGAPSGRQTLAWGVPQALSDYISSPDIKGLLKNARSNKNEVLLSYPGVAKLIREKLFGGTKGTQALSSIQALRGAGQDLYFRFIDSNNTTRYLPLDLLLIDDSWSEQIEASIAAPSALNTVQPLEGQSLYVDHGCVRDWTFILPAKLDGTGEGETAIDPSIEAELRAAGTVIRVLDSADGEPSLESYMAGEPSAHPVGLVLLAHHGGGDLWFSNRTSAWSWTRLPNPESSYSAFGDANVTPRFGEGSVALLVACSTGDVKDPLSLIGRLNANGIDTMIFSPFNIVADFGIRLAMEFAVQVAAVVNAQEDTRATISELYQRAREATIARACPAELPDNSTPAGRSRIKSCAQAVGHASELIMAGNTRAVVCSKEGVNEDEDEAPSP